MSAEFAELERLAAEKSAPCDGVRPGDMYLDKFGNVLLVLKSKGSRKRHNWCWLYYHGSPSLHVSPAKLRDGDANAGTPADEWIAWNASRGESMRYVGNVFERVPFDSLYGR